MTWIAIHHIPSDEKVWRAIYKPDQIYKESGKPKPAFFRDKNGLSCDLARFSTPEMSRVGHADKPYPPETGLVEIELGEVRTVGSDVRHVPIRESRQNYAHAQFTSALGAIAAESLSTSSGYRVNQRFK
jgi:hypothetical protein